MDAADFDGKPRARHKGPIPEHGGKPARKTKKDQLVGLLSKPNGARASLIAERLNWQAHTVRAALSGLRKQGIEIITSKSAKTGETVYAITSQRSSSGHDDAGAEA